MTGDDTAAVRWKLKRIANEAAELPGLRMLAKPMYRRIFERRMRSDNAYFGVFDSYGEARAAVPADRVSTYAFVDAGSMYRDQLDAVRVSDYPLIYWLRRLLQDSGQRIFDLGGHIGVSYYGFARYLDASATMQWLVHDMPEVMAAGRAFALEHDPSQRLAFTDARSDASGCDILVSSGALQYLDYDLPALLASLPEPPRHVLLNLVPMHPERGFYTLQNIGRAILPYRVASIATFASAMRSLGYRVQDQWQSAERFMRIPFEPAHSVDGYQGFCFRRD